MNTIAKVVNELPWNMVPHCARNWTIPYSRMKMNVRPMKEPHLPLNVAKAWSFKSLIFPIMLIF